MKICRDPRHDFKNQPVWINDEVPYEVEVRDDMIVYNGRTDEHWYRASRIAGKEAIETTKPMDGWRYGHKPLSTNCNCQDHLGEKFASVGRFGKWEKGVLSHTAFWDALNIMDKVLGKGQRAVL